MKILLIYPPKNPKVLTPSNFEPLALEILASSITSHEIKIVDLRFEKFQSFIKILKSYQPDIVGLSANNTIQINQSKSII